VESQLGKGSNFIVALPLVHNQGQPTVLVDDDPDVHTRRLKSSATPLLELKMGLKMDCSFFLP
jgi:hypothetical protein